MALRDYMRILLRRGWIIVLLAVVAALSAFVFSRYLVKPEYRSEVLLSVLPTRPADWGSGQGAKGMLNNFAEQIRQNDDVAARVADVLKLDLPPDEERQIVHAAMEQHYRRQLDEPIPALGDISPRQAARDMP